MKSLNLHNNGKSTVFVEKGGPKTGPPFIYSMLFGGLVLRVTSLCPGDTGGIQLSFKCRPEFFVDFLKFHK